MVRFCVHARVADEQQQRDAIRPPLGALVVDVHVDDGEVGARLVGRPAQFGSNHHALVGPCRVPWRTWDLEWCARDVARESVLLWVKGKVGLGDNVEVHSQGAVVDTACSFLHADTAPCR